MSINKRGAVQERPQRTDGEDIRRKIMTCGIGKIRRVPHNIMSSMLEKKMRFS